MMLDDLAFLSSGGSYLSTPSLAPHVCVEQCFENLWYHLLFTQGGRAYLALAPSSAIKLYNHIDDETPMTPHTMQVFRRIGLTTMNFGVYIYCLIFKDLGVKLPFAIHSLIFIAESLSFLINDEPKNKVSATKTAAAMPTIRHPSKN